MGLTSGTGPFGHRPAGSFNFDAPREGVLYLEEFPRWVRGRCGDATVVDSRHPRLLYQSASLPVWYFPEDDVRTELLAPSGRTEQSPPKGEAVFVTLECGGRTIEDAAWNFRDPTSQVPGLAGLIAFRWDAMDEWLDEDQPAIGHPRDPYHRIDVRETSRHVRVSIGGEAVADTRRSKVLYETGLPPRWYIPAEDVRGELITPSDTQTVCAYKGFASYWSVGDEDDVGWTYRDPLHDAGEVGGLIAFFNERVDLEVDEELQERPRTPWSR
jgi:uncharacterized protein (DUF427 family)